MPTVLVPNESAIDITVNEILGNSVSVQSNESNTITVSEVSQAISVNEVSGNNITVNETSTGSVRVSAVSSNIIKIGEGGDLNYVFTQSAPRQNWNVLHNLGKFPSVTVVDSGNSVIITDVSYTDENELTITFRSATSGKAYLN